MGWLDRFKAKGGAPRLAEMIGDYPPYAAPYARAHGKLKADEAQANFEHLMAAKPDRLAMLDSLLARFGLGTGEALDAHDPKPFLDRLHAWSADQWPELQSPQTLAQASWTYDGPRDGPVLAMVGDTGLLLGEMIVRRRPDFAWRLDLDPDDRAMASFRRPCVIRDAGVAGRYPAVADPVDWAYIGFRNCAGPSYRQFGAFGRTVTGYVEDRPGDTPATSAPAPASSPDRGYDNAYDHVDAVAEAGGSANDAAAHIGVFVAWAVLHDLAAPDLKMRATAQIAALAARTLTPGRFVYAVLDGKFRSSDLADAGRCFADAYYGQDGSEPTWNSYLRDAEAILPGFAENGFIPDGWAGYDALAPRLDARYAQWRTAGEHG